MFCRAWLELASSGYYTLALAECVRPKGRVYAVDLDEMSIRALERKADKRGHHNIEAHASSAHDLSFVKDGSVDFVLANGLLCDMKPQHQRESAVNEMTKTRRFTGKQKPSVRSEVEPEAVGFGAFDILQPSFDSTQLKSLLLCLFSL